MWASETKTEDQRHRESQGWETEGDQDIKKHKEAVTEIDSNRETDTEGTDSGRAGHTLSAPLSVAPQ